MCARAGTDGPSGHRCKPGALRLPAYPDDGAELASSHVQPSGAGPGFAASLPSQVQPSGAGSELAAELPSHVQPSVEPSALASAGNASATSRTTSMRETMNRAR